MRIEAAPVDWDRDWAVDLVGRQGDEVSVFSVKGISDGKGGEVKVYDLDDVNDYQDLMDYNRRVVYGDLARSREKGLNKISNFGQERGFRAFWVDVPLR